MRQRANQWQFIQTQVRVVHDRGIRRFPAQPGAHRFYRFFLVRSTADVPKLHVPSQMAVPADGAHGTGDSCMERRRGGVGIRDHQTRDGKRFCRTHGDKQADWCNPRWGTAARLCPHSAEPSIDGEALLAGEAGTLPVRVTSKGGVESSMNVMLNVEHMLGDDSLESFTRKPLRAESSAVPVATAAELQFAVVSSRCCPPRLFPRCADSNLARK